MVWYPGKHLRRIRRLRERIKERKEKPKGQVLKTIEASEIHLRFCVDGVEIINGETGEITKLEPKQIVHIEGTDIDSINVYYDRLATIYGFPAKVRIEPYYG